MPDAFEFKTEELTITLGGKLLDLWGVFTVTCDGDGLIERISWPGGALTDNPYDIDRTRRALFVALEKAIIAKCGLEIAEGIAEGPERRREAYHEHQAEQAMGK